MRSLATTRSKAARLDHRARRADGRPRRLGSSLPCPRSRADPPFPPRRMQLFGRAMNSVVTHAPVLWPLFRRPIRSIFEGTRPRVGQARPRRCRVPCPAGHRAAARQPRAGACARRRHRYRGRRSAAGARVPPGSRARARPLRGDDPPRQRPRRPRPRGPGRVPRRRRLEAALGRGILRSRHAAQHAALLRRDRARAAARRPRRRRGHPAAPPPPSTRPTRSCAAAFAAAASRRSNRAARVPGPTSWLDCPHERGRAPVADRQSLLGLRPRGRAAARGRAPDARAAPRVRDGGHDQPRARHRRGSTPRSSRGETAGRDERGRPDRPDRRGPRRTQTRRWGSSPAGAATTSPACSASRPSPPKRWPCSPSGRPGRIDVGEANGKRFLCIASIGFDSVANRIANETQLLRGGLVYFYAGLRTLATWKAAAVHDPRSTGSGRLDLRGLLGRRSPTAAPSGAASSSRPTPSSMTGSSTW